MDTMELFLLMVKQEVVKPTLCLVIYMIKNFKVSFLVQSIKFSKKLILVKWKLTMY